MQVKSSISFRSFAWQAVYLQGSSRLKTNFVETKMSSEPMDFSDLMGRINC